MKNLGTKTITREESSIMDRERFNRLNKLMHTNKEGEVVMERPIVKTPAAEETKTAVEETTKITIEQITNITVEEEKVTIPSWTNDVYNAYWAEVRRLRRLYSNIG